MMGAKTIGCINHPGVESIGRCRQCGKPVCRQCGVSGAKGIYCSDVCREKHEDFMQRAEGLGLERRCGPGIGLQIRRGLGMLITLAVVLFVLGVISSLTYIPLLTDLTARIVSLLGF